LKVTGINLAALGRTPLTERFSLFAKLGLFIWEAEANDTASGVGFSTSTDGRHASFGVGASYDITRSVAVRAEFENFRIDQDNATLISIGVAVNF
jgi:OOP family OmpA-OmpF porin